jgi:hypothetical protein
MYVCIVCVCVRARTHQESILPLSIPAQWCFLSSLQVEIQSAWKGVSSQTLRRTQPTEHTLQMPRTCMHLDFLPTVNSLGPPSGIPNYCPNISSPGVTGVCLPEHTGQKNVAHQLGRAVGTCRHAEQVLCLLMVFKIKTDTVADTRMWFKWEGKNWIGRQCER